LNPGNLLYLGSRSRPEQATALQGRSGIFDPCPNIPLPAFALHILSGFFPVGEDPSASATGFGCKAQHVLRFTALAGHRDPMSRPGGGTGIETPLMGLISVAINNSANTRSATAGSFSSPTLACNSEDPGPNLNARNWTMCFRVALISFTLRCRAGHSSEHDPLWHRGPREVSPFRQETEGGNLGNALYFWK